MSKSNWKKIKNEYEHSNIPMKKLASKNNVKYVTLRAHKNRNNWKRITQSKSSHVSRNNVSDDTNEINVEVLNKSGLTPKQQKFCLLYLKYYNATKSYHLAYGVKYSVAGVNGWRLLNNANVQRELTKLRQKRVNQLHIDRNDVLAKLVKMYFANIGDYVRFGHKPDEDIDTGKKFQHSYVYFKNQDDVDTDPIAEIKHGKDGPEVKLPDKVKVAKLLLKYIPAPINHNVKSDTLINALKIGLKNESDDNNK